VAHALSCLSTVLATQGDLARAESYCKRSVVLSEGLGDPLGAADSKVRMAGALVYAGQYAPAAALFAAAAATCQALGASSTYALCVHLLAWANTNLGDYELANSQYATAESIWRERNHRHGLALSALGLGELALVREDFVEAHRLLTEAAATFAALKQSDEQAIALADLACALRGLQRHAEALPRVRQSLAIAQSIGAFAPTLFALQAYALLLGDAGEITQALELHTIVGNHPYLAHAAWRQAYYDRYLHRRVEALSAAERAAAIARGQTAAIAPAATAILAGLELAGGLRFAVCSDHTTQEAIPLSTDA
jgi:tetratricopeptide (TPR) repeat protein